MTIKDDTVKFLLEKYDLKKENIARFGIYLDGTLLNVRDRTGKFFATKSGAKFSFWYYQNIMSQLKYNFIPYNLSSLREDKEKRCELEKTLIEVLEELFKEGRLQIKEIP